MSTAKYTFRFLACNDMTIAKSIGSKCTGQRTIAAVFAALLIVVGTSAGQTPSLVLPNFYSNDANGKLVPVSDGDLCDFELELRKRFTTRTPPDEIFALASERPAHVVLAGNGLPVNLTVITISGRQGELRSYASDSPERCYYRKVPPEEIDAIRRFVADGKVDELPARSAVKADGTVTVGGSQYRYLRLTARRGLRVDINNPPVPGDDPTLAADDPSWRYRKVVDFFGGLDNDREKLDVRYEFPRPNKGLEVLFAEPRAEATAVWKHEGKLCVAVRDKGRYDAPVTYRVLRDGKLGEEVADPKMMVNSRVTVDGVTLFPASESTDDRWVVGNRPGGSELACYDRKEMKFVTLLDEDSEKRCYPLYYLDALQMFVLGRLDPTDIVSARRGFTRRRVDDIRFLNPATGETCDIKGLAGSDVFMSEAELWFQDLPRKLQPVAGADHVVWAAKPEYNGTCVGQLDTRTLRLVQQEHVPNLKFETKHVWVDQAERKLYIVYKGQVLRLPMEERQ